MITPKMSRAAVNDRERELIDFTQRIVRAPSISGEEGDVAKIIVSELKELHYDEVWTDEVGNIIGKINGGDGPTILLNGHMDIVDPGPADGWPHPAYSGDIVDGEIWGRGSVDMKGPVASMIYSAAQYKQLSIKPTGDVLMTVAVMEEIGGLGTQFLTSHTTADAAIVGEPSRNELRLGHRGRIELQVTFRGRSAHASAPDLAINPHFAAAEFLKLLPSLELGVDPVLGPATIAPTLYQTDQQSANVIPSIATLFLDWRNVPSETQGVALEKIQSLLDQCTVSNQHPGCPAPQVRITRSDLTTYTGAVKDFAAIFPPFATSPDHGLAKAANTLINSIAGREKPIDVWQFATDGGHLVAAGVPTIGYGPGDDRLAHTNQERLEIESLKESTATYAPLIGVMTESLG